MTELEHTIVLYLIARPAELKSDLLRRVLPHLSGELGARVQDLDRVHPALTELAWVGDYDLDQVPPASEEADREIVLRNLSKWLHHQSVALSLLSEDVYAATLGSVKDLTRRMREAKPKAQRRRGAGTADEV